jgi:hypothetical protein
MSRIRQYGGRFRGAPEVSVKFYAERPARRLAQLVTDLLALGWLAAGGRLAWGTFDQINRLQAPGMSLERAGHRISGAFTNGATAAGRTPLVGDELASALGTGSDAGTSLAEAGRAAGERTGGGGRIGHGSPVTDAGADRYGHPRSDDTSARRSPRCPGASGFATSSTVSSSSG